MIMRHVFVVGMSNRRGSSRLVVSALAVASALLPVAAFASADAMYRWRDDAGRVHFSNDRKAAPAGAQELSLPNLTVGRPASPAAERPSEAAVETAGRAVEPPPVAAECDAPDPSPLIDAITSRLDSIRSDPSPAPGLTLLVAGVPVSYSANADVQTWPASGTDWTAAGEQAAIAYPASGGCPRTPPLERYEVAATSNVRPASSAGLCDDYRRASVEVEMAISRNEDVARSFQFAAARFDSLTGGGVAPPGAGEGSLSPMPWFVEAGAAQTTELAAEIDELMEELTVAREEIDRAAEAQGCW